MAPALLARSLVRVARGRVVVPCRALPRHPTVQRARLHTARQQQPLAGKGSCLRAAQARSHGISPALVFNQHRLQQVRHMSAASGAARSVASLAGRVLLYPAMAVGAIGGIVTEMKKKMPDMEDLGISEHVNSFVDALKGLKEKVQKEVHSFTAAKPPVIETPPIAASTGGESSGAGEPKAAAAAAQHDADDKDDLPAEVRRQKEQIDQLVATMKEHMAEIAKLEHKLHETEEHANAELLQERARLQSEIDRLVEENKDLRRTMLLDDMKSTRERPRRPIDIFSDILDLRAKIDPGFSAHDHLPRVVVVGDQSAGKTSVLEVIVRARIFPRGLGEMMTRSPIQVTLSEGEEHIAQIKGQDRLYHLDSESDLARLRKDIEHGMLSKLKGGQVVSPEPLSLVVRGPGLHPLVLVDLPGIIQANTLGMPDTTKGSIFEMCQNHIENPNAIILCIQDASRDPEGSGVADMIRNADPQGDRTIFVLTKVDLAEQLKLPSQKLQTILKGQKFNMKAKSYFAVVTGTSNPNDSIDSIRKAEKEYFQQSSFFRQGVFSPRKTGTDNLSRAVSELFWDRVRETVAHEAREIGLALKKKETEWRNAYPNQHRQSRDDLYAMGRHLILENMANYAESSTAAQQEAILIEEIWDTVAPSVFNMYITAADSDDPASFKTNMENMLDTWVSNELPDISFQVAHRTLVDEFLGAIDFKDAHNLFDDLKAELKRHCSSSVVWDPRSISKVKGFQEMMLRDDVVKSAADWDRATKFMIAQLKDEYSRTQDSINELQAPSTWWSWVTWTSATKEQTMRSATMQELSSYFTPHNSSIKQDMSFDELRAVQHNLKIKHGLDVDHGVIQDSYSKLYKIQFFERAIKSAQYCQSRYGHKEQDNKAPNGLQCADVLLFWRIHNMMQATSRVLRLEGSEYKRDLDNEVREKLNELATDTDAKQRLIHGHRVTLAEEIEILRHIQAKLDAFIKMLRKDGQTTRLTGGYTMNWQ